MKAQIIDQVDSTPGIHFRKLQREVGCSKSTLNYHIGRVESLEDQKIRGYRRIFNSEVSKSDRNALAALNHSPRGEIIYYIDEGEHTLKQISGKVDRSAPTISHHLKVLQDAELVEKKDSYVLNRSAAKAVKRYASDILDSRVDGFIRMWE